MTDPTFTTAAQSSTKVALLFTDEMSDNAALTNPSSYGVTDLQGNSITVLSVTAGQAPITRVELELGSSLNPFNWYPVTVAISVETATHVSLNPRSRLIQWTPRSLEWNIRIPLFTGEVEEGLLGEPAGQIFFSPALETALGNSILEVDDANLCTKAFDEYEIPQTDSSEPFNIWNIYAPSSLLGQAVLWAPSDQQGRPRFDLSDLREDTVSPPVDGPADAVLGERDPNRISLLNNSSWVLFDNIGQPFVTADTINGPIPVVNGSTINLQP